MTTPAIFRGTEELHNAANRFAAIAQSLNESRTRILNATNHATNASVWQGRAAFAFTGASGWLQASVTDAGQGFEQAATATRIYGNALQQGKDGWIICNKQLHKLQAELQAAKTQLAQVEAAMVQRSAMAAFTGFTNPSLGAMFTPAPAPVPLIAPAQIQAHIDHLNREIHGVQGQMQTFETEAEQAARTYAAAVDAMAPQAPSSGGGILGTIESAGGAIVGGVAAGGSWLANEARMLGECKLSYGKDQASCQRSGATTASNFVDQSTIDQRDFAKGNYVTGAITIGLNGITLGKGGAAIKGAEEVGSVAARGAEEAVAGSGGVNLRSAASKVARATLGAPIKEAGANRGRRSVARFGFDLAKQESERMKAEAKARLAESLKAAAESKPPQETNSEPPPK